jgi:hypothetical protein
MSSQFTPPSDIVSERRKKYDSPYQNNSGFKSEYRIGTLEYPDGLRTKPDLQHYVAFFINVRDKGRLGKNGTENKDYYVSKEEQDRVNLLNQEYSPRLQPQAVAAATQTVLNNSATLAAAGYVAARLGAGGIRKRDLPGLAIGTGAAAIAGKFAKNLFQSLNLPQFADGGVSRLKEVITLHLEDRPSVSYKTNYNNGADMGFLTGLLIQGSAAASAGTLKQMEPEIQARVLSQLAKLPVLNNLRELSTRTKTNPFREVLFESVGYRAFAFKYRFFPKNKSESQKIYNIINTLKIHMHPELSGGKLFYLYPSEFDIQYYYKDQENNYLNKFARCALTDLNVEYGGEQFATFEDGSPVEIGLSLTFQELEQMTSEGIEKHGY